VLHGGEGVIIKPKDGRYYHKRGREYQKIKKFLTREVIIMGFAEPTEEYKGKFPTPEIWPYWLTNEQDRVDLTDSTPEQIAIFKKNWYPDECAPVSKFFANGWVGNVRFGVIITDEEIAKLPKNKKFNIEEHSGFIKTDKKTYKIIEVGECSGFDEEQRALFTEHRNEYVGEVIEIKANELFKDTGKMRHPRFLRERPDKLFSQCTWKDHIGD
jgi:ATP-dependent DNA ligase